MGKLYDRLKRQLKSNEFKKDAEDCIKIYEILKEMNDDGRILAFRLATVSKC